MVTYTLTLSIQTNDGAAGDLVYFTDADFLTLYNHGDTHWGL